MTDLTHSPLSSSTTQPRLEPRPLDEALYARAQSEGLSELQARLLASRLPGYSGELKPLIAPSLRYLAHPEKLHAGPPATHAYQPPSLLQAPG